jgi:copper chaperone CopZ
MTQLDVVYRYFKPPTERTMFALSGLSEVYGIRSVAVDEAAKTIRIEFDATRLTRPIVAQLVRRTGLEIEEEVPLAGGQPTLLEPPATVRA